MKIKISHRPKTESYLYNTFYGQTYGDYFYISGIDRDFLNKTMAMKTFKKSNGTGKCINSTTTWVRTYTHGLFTHRVTLERLRRN